MRRIAFLYLIVGLQIGPAAPSRAQQPSRMVYTAVDEPPRFPDSAGAEAFVAEHLVYPEAMRRAGRQGKVIVRFVVEPDGQVSGIRVLRSPDDASGTAVVRAVQAMPRWQPGRLRGAAVRTAVVLPVYFGLR